MKFYTNGIVLLLSSFSTPVMSLMNSFTDPLLRIRHMIPPTVVPKEHMQNSEIHVFEGKNINKQETPCILFFTGGNALISHEIYSNFLVTLSNKNLAVHTIPFRYKTNDFIKLVDQLNTEYANIVAVSHSSGSSPLINTVSQNPKISKIVMMDPIDSRLDRTKKIKLKYVKKLMIIRAEKAYEGENLSFIPGFLELSQDKLRLSPDCKVSVLDSENYGHCDLLNPMYSNLIHQYLRNICDGSSNRSHDHLYKYIEWLSDKISEFAYDNPSKDIPISNFTKDDKCDEIPSDINL